ncbi:hypothetical protein BKI52_36760 [marine bacterium AO1-C]|nr:hypothetical protein BKI52_36760 [marine bacterium AO1-C]
MTAIPPLKIGFLTPYSGIYPEMSHHIVYGFLMPFVKYNNQGKQLFRIDPEYVKQGGQKAVTEAVKKLLFFDQVDIISGVINYQVVPEILPLIEKRDKVAFFFDSGEYMPHPTQLSTHVFYNSFQLWQSQYALGYWAQREFGGKGAVVMGLYDSGYHMHSAFRQGTIQAGAEAVDYAVLGRPNSAGQDVPFSEYVDKYLENIIKNPPEYIHALFCGQEAIQFLAKYYDSPLKNKVPLIVSNHMSSEEILASFNHFEWQIYSASIWSNRDSNKINQKFVKGYQEGLGQKPNMFNLLGYEAGLMFREMTTYFEKRDWPAIRQTLQKKSIRGPRGSVNFYPKSGFDLPKISIEKLLFRQNKITRMIVSQGQGLKYDHEIFSEINQEIVSGWQNPYFCV